MASYYIKLMCCIGNYDFSESAYTYTQITPSEVTINFDVENQKDVERMVKQIRILKDTLLDINGVNINFVYKHNGKVYSSVITNIVGFDTDFSDYLEDEDEE